MKPSMNCVWSVSHMLSRFKLHHVQRETHPVQQLSVLYDERMLQQEAKLRSASQLIRAAQNTLLQRLGNVLHLRHRLTFQMDE